MAPTTTQRKSLPAAPMAADPFTSSAPRRTTAGRTIRPNATRPANYYARPYGSLSSAAVNGNGTSYAQESDHGFFPAIQFFSDAIVALPKETMRQFTLMKEVEAKIHGPNQRMGEMIDALLELPTPVRNPARAEIGGEVRAAGLLSFTANNSRIGSANVSVVNGAMDLASARNSIVGSIDGDAQEDMARRRKYYELRLLAQGLLSNLDEKNVVLAEANRVMNQQMLRIDSVLPHIDNEISEDARLGSMTHWAYSDNRQKKTIAGNGAHSRAVQATNALASAASAMHEADISQARRDAGREAAKDKQKGRLREQFDSDFDDRPKKTQKVARAKPSASAGLGITTNGDLTKKRKVEKLVAPGMERSASAKTAKVGRESPRGTPALDASKKVKTKPAPAPKKRGPLSAANSPAMTSSPLAHSFQPIVPPEAPAANARPQSSRLRQNSSSNLRHERLADEAFAAPSPPIGKSGGFDKFGVKKSSQIDTQAEEKAEQSIENTNQIVHGTVADKREDVDRDRPEKNAGSKASSNSGRGDNSKNGTPRAEGSQDPAVLVRTRSARHNGGHESSSSESQQRQGQSHGHKRALSNSHLVRQLAPYNRSPDLDRHRGPNEDDDEDVDGTDVRERPVAESRSAPESASEEKRPERRVLSRRNTGMSIAASVSISENVADDEDETMASFEESVPIQEPELIPDAVEVEFDDEDSDHDPDDPNEPRYCYCNRGSYGEMVACDNGNCVKEWFHLGCTELTQAPEEHEQWFCRDCRPRTEKRRAFRGVRAKGI